MYHVALIKITGQVLCWHHACCGWLNLKLAMQVVDTVSFAKKEPAVDFDVNNLKLTRSGLEIKHADEIRVWRAEALTRSSETLVQSICWY